MLRGLLTYAHPHTPDSPTVAKAVARPSVQLRAAYLQFMVSVATMLREDMNLPKNSHLVQNDVAQVLELEMQLANARPLLWAGQGGNLGPRHSTPLWPPAWCRPQSHGRTGVTSPPCTTRWTWGSSRTSLA